MKSSKGLLCKVKRTNKPKFDKLFEKIKIKWENILSKMI